MNRLVPLAGVLALAAVLGLLGFGLRQPSNAAGQEKPATTNAGGTADRAPRPADRDAIRLATANLLKAFESGDAKALAACWTADGEYSDDNGTTIRGRDALEKTYAEFFTKSKGLKAEGDVESLRFLSRDTAIEDGHLKVRKGQDHETTVSRYSALYVREDGKWLVAVLREWSTETSLRELDWLIGTWVSKRDDIEVRTTFEWELDKKFIQARFTVKEKDRTITGLQMIGADPATGQLRSWTFEAGGGFGESVWSRDGKKWMLDSVGTQADGTISTATNILTRLDHDSFTWQSVDRTSDGVEQPDVPPIKVTRVKGKD